VRRQQGLQIMKATAGEAILLLDDACAEPPQSRLLADALLPGGLPQFPALSTARCAYLSMFDIISWY
jgi:hypothetical protein